MVAGLLLKNNIRDKFVQMPDETKQYIRDNIIVNVGDPHPQIRKTVASIITTIVAKSGLTNWSNLLPSLIQFLDSSDLNFVEGTFKILYCLISIIKALYIP